MYDIIFITNGSNASITRYKQFKLLYPLAKQAKTYDEAKAKSFTKLFWMIWYDVEILPTFNFTYEVPEWDQKYIHVFKHDASFVSTGVCLSSKEINISKREFEYRCIINNKKEIDIFASATRQYEIFCIDTYKEYLDAMENCTTDMFWMTSNKISVVDNFKFDIIFDPFDGKYDYDRNENHVFIHRGNGKDTYNGVFLLSKNKPLSKREVEYRFLVQRKEWDIVASTAKTYEIFCVDTYQEYLDAMENCSTGMFWMTSKKIAIAPDFKFDITFDPFDGKYDYDRNENHVFIHRDYEKDTYSGVFLLSKNKPLTKREVEYRFPVQRKEWDIVASVPPEYEKFTLDTYNDYLNAVSTSNTELFWNIPSNVTVDPNFKFNLFFGKEENEYTYDKNINHLFLNGEHYDGITLYSTHSVITEKEFTNRFLLNKKEWDVLASTPKPYDIVFISYNEPFADDNFIRLQSRFPYSIRVHGVKGIHQAHIEAAKLATTEMFWVVDADALIEDSFNFEFEYVPYRNVQRRKVLHSIVHVWQSKNPVNGLIYGYGGVKFLPKALTMNMSTDTTDMTTSISSKFKLMPAVSNTTFFNTDPFNTWKSAFRECVKLSSKVIDGQVDDETEQRLTAWCVLNESVPYGFYAYAGALAGKQYGQENAGNKPALSLINDFDWLQTQFEIRSVAIGNT